MPNVTTVAPPKKLLPLLILEVLWRDTDENHKLSQRDIQKLLEQRYDMKVDRKTIRRNIGYLMDAGWDIEHEKEVPRRSADSDGEGNVMVSDLWLVHEFTDEELRYLIDGLLFTTHIPREQRLELIDKLESLSSKYFESHMKHVSTVRDAQPQNKQLFLTVAVLDEAIARKRKVAFEYLEYRTDGKAHPKCRKDGSVREYVVSPYQMAARQGKYYLICNYDKYNDISNYRVDRISEIRILEDQRIKPFESLDGADNAGLDLEEYMNTHIYMYSSDQINCRFRITKPMISDVIDLFGTGVKFFDETDTHVTVSAKVNRRAMRQFAKNFGPDVIVLSPQDLADEVCKELCATLAAYNEL